MSDRKNLTTSSDNSVAPSEVVSSENEINLTAKERAHAARINEKIEVVREKLGIVLSFDDACIHFTKYRRMEEVLKDLIVDAIEESDDNKLFLLPKEDLKRYRRLCRKLVFDDVRDHELED